MVIDHWRFPRLGFIFPRIASLELFLTSRKTYYHGRTFPQRDESPERELFPGVEFIRKSFRLPALSAEKAFSYVDLALKLEAYSSATRSIVVILLQKVDSVPKIRES